MRASVCVVAGILVLAGRAAAQCDESFTIDLQKSYIEAGEPTPDELQSATAPWLYRDHSAAGFMLTGVMYPSGVAVWANPSQPYAIPLSGPVCSPDPAINRSVYHDRPFSMDGVMLHPGYTGHNLYTTFSVWAPVTLTSLQFRGEVVGNASDGVSVSVQAHRSSTGTDLTLIPATHIPYTTSGHTLLTATPGTLPLSLGGINEPVIVTVSSGAEPFEDWLNGQVTMTMTGGPVIYALPRSAGACQNTPTQLHVGAASSGTTTYQWVKQVVVNNQTQFHAVLDGPTAWGSTISGSQTATLSIAHASPSDGGKYHVYVGSTCPSLPTLLTFPAAILTICIADFDCSGFVDLDDFSSFIAAFEAGTDDADVDGSGFVDLDDFVFFVLAFEAGC